MRIRSKLLAWLVGVAASAAVCAPDRALASRRIVVLFVAGDAVPEEVLTEVRADLDAVLVEADYQPVAPSSLDAKAPEPWDDRTAACLSDPICTEQTQARLGVAAIVCIELRGTDVGGELVGRVWAQRDEVGSGRINTVPGAGDMLVHDLAGAVRWALRDVETEAARAQAARRTMVRPRPVPIEERPPASVVERSAPVEQPGEAGTHSVTTDPPPAWELRAPKPERPTIGIELGVWGGLAPIKHHRTHLLAGNRVARERLGAAAAGVSLDFRLPSNELDDIFEINRYTYGFHGPLSVMTFDVGVEHRWETGLLAPVLGGTLCLGRIGLPVVDQSGARRAATAWSAGAQLHGGFTARIGERAGLQVRLGYRWFRRHSRTFTADGVKYFARDVHGDTWETDLSGILAEAGITFEI